MHRGGGVEEELLAISPPPEFQDLPAPPPAVFRDLSPSSSSSSTGNKGRSHHHQLHAVISQGGQRLVWDFASRISFDILNEAMVIATEEVVSHSHHQHGHCATTAPIGHHQQGFHHNPADSSEDENEASNPSSLTTSWEYLSKNSPWTAQKLNMPPDHAPRSRCCPNKTSSTSAKHFPNTDAITNIVPLNGINRSTSFHDKKFYANDILVVQQPTNSKSRNETPSQPIKQEVQHRCGKRNNSGVSVRHSVDAGNLQLLRENYQHDQKHNNFTPSDTYSLPIDNIASDGLLTHVQNHNSSKPIAAPRRARINTSSNSTNTNQCANHRDFKEYSLGLAECSAETSRLHINSKELGEPVVVGGSLSPLSTKPVKRTIGHSILNLFKRKSRSKCETFLDSENPVRPFNPNEGTPTLLLTATPSTSTRALPSPPVPPLSSLNTDAEPEIGVRISYTDEQEHHDNRAVPWDEEVVVESPVEAKDFAASIERVKDCGWYWGPLSSESAEDLLRGEPDGSFIVRDSSDAHYIFSLTFKLNGLVRHVRIEHDQGNFSFGPLTRFKASTIVDFVEKAVAHSRSGRYLFFLHRRPVLGPMRVQLLHPYSRFRHPRSLQHMCRFVILKYVRRDLISSLPLPKPLQEYLNTPHYYFEKHESKKLSSS